MGSVIIIVLLSGAGVVGDFFIKRAASAKTIDWKFFIMGALIYALTAFGWVYIMRHVKLSVLGIIYAISTALLLIFVSLFFFKESLNWYEISGIALGISSLMLLSRFL